MADERTPEQVAADDELNGAIRRVIALGGHNDLLTDWVVVYACVSPEDYDRTTYGTCYPGGQIQAYRAIGLLDLAAHQLRTGGWEDDA